VKANWIGHLLRRKCLQHVVEGKIVGRMEVMGRRGSRSKYLLDGLIEERGYWELNGETVDRTVWRTRFGKGCGPVVRQIAELTLKLPD